MRGEDCTAIFIIPHLRIVEIAISVKVCQLTILTNRTVYQHLRNGSEYKELGSHALQATLKRVDFAYQRFFTGKGGYPKFKSIRHYSGWT
jgi:transposase